MKKRLFTWIICLIILLAVSPMQVFAAETVASGTCGENVTWTLDDAGTLTISGTGDMMNYTYNSCAPWNEHREVIKTVVIENGVTSIGVYAFDDCSSLTEITIPEGVTTIGGSAFSGCSSLTEITIPEGVTSIGDDAFYDCSSLTEITIPESITSIGKFAFYDCSSLSTITIPEGVTSIDRYTFYGCSSLTEITIPEGVTSIGNSAFSDCYGLTAIDIPDGVIAIGENAFSNCSRLISIDIPDGVSRIGNYTFYFCTKLTDISIPEGVTAIGYYAFACCSSLPAIDIPGTVTSIGMSAFEGCDSLTSIRFQANAPAFSYDCFYGVTATAYYPAGNPTWTEDVMHDHSGDLTWVAYHPDNTHNHVAEITAPTCTEQGYTTYTCPCGDSYVDDYVDALSHDWDEWEETKVATCTEDGSKTRSCQRCGATETEVISAEGHVHEAVVTSPTCEENGYTTYTCANCGDTYTADEVTSLGHDLGEWKITAAPNCTEAGAKRRECSRCDHFETEEITATGHDHEAVVTSPTCEEVGYTTYTCANCGDTYTSDEVTSLGHDLGEWETTAAPTCTEGGAKRRKCSRCDHFETEEITATGHDYEAVVTPPTCKENGYTTYTCANCGDTYTSDEVTAFGHMLGENNVCTVCGQVPIVASGECGENLTWTLDSNGLLTISGTGKMSSFAEGTSPWHMKRASVKTVVIEDGVTSIGNYAFEDCSSLTEITIPESVTSIGASAFRNCISLTEITIPEGVTSIDRYTFYGCSSLTEITFTGPAPEIDSYAFLSVTATAYYPGNNPTWTEEVMVDYGGNLTWAPYNPDMPFSDVPYGAFYEDPVIWAVENGITTGATPTTFDPNGACLRAHVVTFLHRAAGTPEPTSTNNPFTDVASGNFFYKPVLWAVEKGITNGTSATEFGSYANCNRAQVVTFLWRASGSPEPTSTNNPFVDVPSNAFYYKAVLWAVENGITNGIDATHFGPTTDCNRAQVVTFLYRSYNK